MKCGRVRSFAHIYIENMAVKLPSIYSTTYEYIHTYIQLVFNMLIWGSLRLTSTRAATYMIYQEL